MLLAPWIAWPNLQLTELEKSVASYYTTTGEDGVTRPGVMRKIYTNTLIKTLVAGEQPVVADRFLPSGRRTRCFAITFSGDVEFWRIQLASLTGEQYVQILPATGLPTSKVPVGSFTGLPSNPNSQAINDLGLRDDVLARAPSRPFIRDPSIVLEGTQGIQIDGDVDGNIVVAPGDRSVLNIAFHVWEFPKWGTPLPQGRGEPPPVPLPRYDGPLRAGSYLEGRRPGPMKRKG